MILILHDGRSLEFTDTELGQTLARLEALNQSYCLGASDTAHVRAGTSLLVMDVGWSIGRKLIEGYAISGDTSFPYGLRFTLGQTHYTLEQALAGSGYVGDVTALSDVYMGMYSQEAQVYVENGQLVKSTGAFATSPAQLKSLIAGGNMTITEDLDTITLEASTGGVDQSVFDAFVSSTNTALADKQDVLTASLPLSITGSTISLDTSGFATQEQANMNFNATAANALAIIGKADQSYVDGQLALKANILSTGNPSDFHAKILDITSNGSDIIKALQVHPPPQYGDV